MLLRGKLKFLQGYSGILKGKFWLRRIHIGLVPSFLGSLHGSLLAVLRGYFGLLRGTGKVCVTPVLPRGKFDMYSRIT